MNTQLTLIAGLCAAVSLAAPASAQDTEMFQLPPQCSDTPLGGMDMAGMQGSMMDDDMVDDMGQDMGMSHDGHGGAMMPEHVRENMAKMMVTMPAMQQGMMQQDADIAFACGMIAHHQAAIDMAAVVLDHGQDPEMRSLAEEIISAQTREIDFMTQWLESAAN